MTGMRVKIDGNRCQGHNRCVAVAPEIFEPDDEGLALLKQDPIPSGKENQARRAALSCPERAITVIEED